MNEQKRVRVFRAVHDKDNPYFQMRRDSAQNKSMTYEALGMLAYILSKSDTWEVMISDLEREGTGRDRAYRILGELMRLHYIRRVGVRNNGKFNHVDYEVYETPYTEKPDTVLSDTANPTPVIKEKKKRQKKISSSPKATDPIKDALNASCYKSSGAGYLLGPLTSWLKGEADYVTSNGEKTFVRRIEAQSVENIAAFAAWYGLKRDRSGKALTMPRNVASFVQEYLDFLETRPVSAPVSSEPLDLPERHPDMFHPKVQARQKELGRWLTAAEIDVLMGGL